MLSHTSPYLLAVPFSLLLAYRVCCQIHYLYLWLSCLLLECAVKTSPLSLTVLFTIGVCCEIHHLIFDCPVYYWCMLSNTSPYLWLSRLLLAWAVKCLTVSLAATFTIGVCCQILYFWLPRLLLAYAVRCITLSLTAPFTIGVWCQIHHLDCPVYYWRMLSDTPPYLWLSRLLMAYAIRYITLSLTLPFNIGVCCQILHFIFCSPVYYWVLVYTVKCITLCLTVAFIIKYWCMLSNASPYLLSLIHIWRCRRAVGCRSRWSPYH